MRLTAGVAIGGSMSWLSALALAAGAQPDSTTTVVPTPGIDATSTAAENPAQATLVWIIGGLLLLGLVVLVFTVIFWRRTRPGLAAQTGAPSSATTSGPPVAAVARGVASGRAADGATPLVPTGRTGAGSAVASSAPAQTIAPVRIASPDELREVPLWADEPSGKDDAPR